jgi:DnaJ homolog subfamily C member 19
LAEHRASPRGGTGAGRGDIAVKFLVLIGLLVAFWGWRSARTGRISHGDLAAAIGVIVGVSLFRKGDVAWAGAAGAGVAAWVWWRMRAMPAVPMASEEAHRLLDLPQGADAETIRAAHRRLIARVHPDAGGSEELARRVNAARDALLAEVNSARPRAS